MAKPEKNERDYFTDLELQILLCNEKIKNHKKSIEKVKKACGWYGPSGVSGIDYSRQPSNSVHISFAEALECIERDQKKIDELTAERIELRRTKKRVQKIYEKLDGTEAQIYYYRVIKKLTQENSAKTIGLSTRQLQRIEADMKEKGLL